MNSWRWNAEIVKANTMELLNRIVSYWYDCIKNEDVLEKDISINVRSKAALYPFDDDPFIFNRKDSRVCISQNERLATFSEYVNTSGYDQYYGYPVLFYLDTKTQKHLIAPLFIIKVKSIRTNNDLYLQKDEAWPTCGIQALSRIGFRAEEIAEINRSVESIFATDLTSNKKEISQKCLEFILKESTLQINEPIDPCSLTNATKLSNNTAPGLHNKSILFAGDSTNYNVHLLKDLLELKDRKDLDDTALSFILGKHPSTQVNKITPILPFPANEYQVKAMQNIFENKLSVITGPPGTGKSQFISNLLVNLFLGGKSVLFVSHTNEAVNVVNTKINNEFRNLMIQTGNKEIRQELKGKFNELILDSERRSYVGHNLRSVKALWQTINKQRALLGKIDSLERKFEELYYYCNHGNNICDKQSILSRLLSAIRKLPELIKYRLIKMQLERIPIRPSVEKEITKLQSDFYELSRSYIKSTYVDNIMGKGRNIGRVNAFLHEVDSKRYNDNGITPYLFRDAIEVLRIWSCTLKSVRATFPLTAGIFDYVIFDEASQVDLPSAAPALYRAKRVVVVGDPMQLSHIASITRDIDKKIAGVHGLDRETDIYPSRTRYCDVSLYRSAEHSLTQKPILLVNHYRSEDQIITLCNKSFYEGQLKIRTILDYSKYPEEALPIGVRWVDCQGQCFKHPGGSRINQDEASLVNRVFQDVLRKISKTDLSIGIVTPYSRQENAIREEILKSTPVELIDRHAVKILTAHKFQGSEKDIMIFSLVLAARGNGNSDIWYNIYPQILNVALSRAKYLLYIIGDKKFCHSRRETNRDVLKKLAETYDEIDKQTKLEEYTLKGKFDTKAERHLFKNLQRVDFNNLGYKLETQRVVKRYTLDFAITGMSGGDKQKKKLNVECDGYQHEIIEGLPVIEDVVRDEFLEKEGWTVIRFPNHKILSDTDAVISQILAGLVVGNNTGGQAIR